MQVKTFKSCNAIEAKEWDSILTDRDIFHTHRFLKSVEFSQVENATYQFIMFYKEEQLVGSAVLSIFTIALDLLVPNHSLFDWVKKIGPNFFKVKVCFCGTPISAGHRNLIITDATSYEEILPILNQCSIQFSKSNNCSTIIFKEFFNEQVVKMESIMTQLGYFKGYSLPYLQLPIRWKTFETYQNDMRSSYRHQFKKSWLKINAGNDKENNAPIITISSPLNYNYQEFYTLYSAVMSRAKVRLELLNEQFFKQAFENMGDEILLVSLTQNNKNIATHFLVKHGEELTFAWAGKPNATNEFDDYFNLMAAMVAYAINNDYKVLNFGQTANYTKQRLGAQPLQLNLFFKSRSWLWHQLIKLLKKEIFPKVALPHIKVFK